MVTKNSDKRGWIQFGIQLIVIVIVASIAWGAVTTDLDYTKKRVTKIELVLEKLTDNTTNMALDMREIKTLMKTKLEDDE